MKIQVNKQSLISVLKGNRNKHQEEFNQAREGYLIECRQKLEQAIKQLDKEKYDFSLSVYLPKPSNHLKAYDQMIGMLEMDLSDTRELDETQYKNYVQDEWEWSNQFKAMASGYASNIRNF